MERKIKFYRCPFCGRMTEVREGDNVDLVCCGEEMKELIANTTDAANEKHVPVCSVEGENVVVTVGEVIHPMEQDHYIMWIAQVTENDINKVELKPGQEPKATFKYVENAEYYAFCNKHSLWKNNK